MAVVRHFYFDFILTAMTDGPLVLGIWNFAWRDIRNIFTNCV